MKNIKLTISAGVLMLCASCTKNFDKLNSSPLLVTKDIIEPSILLTTVEKNSIFNSYSNSTFKEYSNYYTNEATGTIFQDRDWTTPFSDYQTNIINISEVVRLTAGKAELTNENAIARIFKVWLFHQLTDAYGDLPYTDAAHGNDSVVNQPKYDTQQSIYEDMLNELKVAAAALSDDASQKSYGSAELIYSGDVDKWKRFANSLRLRLALRVRYADAELAQQHITDVVSQPLIDDNALNATLTTLDGNDINNKNPLYLDFVNSSGYPVWVGFTVTQELLKRDDPRLPIYVDLPHQPQVGYRGRPMCLIGDEKVPYNFDSTAFMPLSFQQPVQTIIVMNTAEVDLLRAEAALAGLSTEDAQTLYHDGIAAALAQYNVASGDADTYLASQWATLSGSEEEKLEDIIVQKYLAMYNQGVEAWAEYRRTGYPKIWTGGDLGSTGGTIPRRLTYPVSEYQLNSANVSEAVSRLQGGDEMTSRMWWDAKPGLPFLHPKQGTFPPEIY